MDEMAKETPGGVELEEYASERVPSTPPQHTTLRMTCFALFISLIGWLFNFDLGRALITTLGEVRTLTQSSQATAALSFKCSPTERHSAVVI